MTEAEWLSCSSPEPLLAFLRERGASDRKLRLFAAACCRDVWDLIQELERGNIGYGCVAVELAEKLADGQATREAVAVAVEDRVGLIDSGSSPESQLLQAALPALADADAAAGAEQVARATVLARHRAEVRRVMTAHPEWGWASKKRQTAARQAVAGTRARQAGFLRDLFTPHRPATFDPSWRTSTVVALAATMYQSRDFSLMPILGDALMDAGCDDEQVLDHCRGGNEHHRGCFVVDLVLGKA